MALTTEQQTSHLSRLQREVLGWDYFTMGDGSIDRSGKDKGKQSKLKDVPNTFKDVNEYLSIFQPLVLEECAAQITRGDDDDESVSREGGASTIGAVFKTSRVDGFHVVQFILGEDAMRRFHDNDLILVSKTHPHEEIPVPEGCFDPDASAEKADAKNDDGKKTEKENDQSASAIPDGLHNVHALGYVDGRDSRNMMRVRFFLPDNTNSRVVGSVAVTGSAKSGGKKTDSKKGATAKGAGDNNGAHKSTSAQKTDHDDSSTRDDDYARYRSVRNALSSPKSAWYLTHLANMSTIAREWLALRAFPSLPFAHAILGAAPENVVTDKALATETQTSPTHEKAVWELPEPLGKAMAAAYNDSQLRALRAALEKQPITLIQGPPGTGKTRIILSLLSVILHARPGQNSTKFGHELDLKRFLERRADAPRGKSDALTVKKNHAASSPWMRGAHNPRDAPPDRLASTSVFLSNDSSQKTDVPEIVGERFKKRQKILVCAPSNAALDEIVLRIMHSGLLGPDGKVYSPTLVRVGVNAHHSVEKVSMEYLVNERCGGGEEDKFSDGKGNGNSSNKFEKALERDRVKCLLLDEAQVVCSTLSFSGSGMFSRMTKQFDVVVIDEAAQAVEPSTLVPLCYGAKQAFLVGDPRQLPATVLSAAATAKGYARSLFSRFEQCGYPVYLLKTQYRMHPDIRAFPSKTFYNDELADGPFLASATKRNWHQSKLFRPFVFYDVDGAEYKAGNSQSWQNDEEARLVVSLVTSLVKKHPQLLNQGNQSGGGVGVISPYKAQVKHIRHLLEKALGKEKARAIDVNSIDGFQGREKEVCVFSVVRAPKGETGSTKTGATKKNVNLGFVADERRVNVGLTRAKTCLLVVGSSKALKNDKTWGGLVRSAVDRDLVMRPTGKTQAAFDAFVTKHSLEYDDDDLSGDEAEGDDAGAATNAGNADEGLDEKIEKKVASTTVRAPHSHKPEWHTAPLHRPGGVQTIRDTPSGFVSGHLVDELVTENHKVAKVGGGDDGIAPSDDGDHDAFVEVDETKGKKTASGRGTKRTAGGKAEKAPAGVAKKGRGGGE